MLPHRNTARKPGDGEQGLSEVIGFVLILGLIVIFIALWMTYVVPAEGRENEIRHMNDVRDWFTQYKITLDSLWINSISDNAPAFPTISNSLTLGSQGGATQAGGFYLPLMKPIGSTGGLAVANYGERIRILVDGDPKRNMTLGTLEFRGSNNYWIPQTYYYQMGGVFLQQEGGTVVRVAPLIDLKNYGTYIDLDITPLNISGGGLVSISGQGPVRVDTRLDTASGSARYPGTNMSVILTLRDARTALAWESVLREIQISRGIPPTNPTMNCTISRSGSTVTMTIRSSNQSNVTIYYPANYTVSLQSIATGIT